MKIRCPNCGRMGYLPDRLVPAANSLRCRRCLANFTMPEPSHKGKEPLRKDLDTWRGATVDVSLPGRSRENPALLLADGFVASFDEPDGSTRKPGPGDSHYEVTIALKDEPGSSGDEWMAGDASMLEPEVPSSDEIEAIPPTDSSLSDPLPYDLIMSWIRPLCYVSLGFVALSVLLVGFLAVRSLELVGSAVLPLATHALVLASLATVAFLLFGIWIVLLSVVLADVAQSLRRLRGWGGRGPGR